MGLIADNGKFGYLPTSRDWKTITATWISRSGTRDGVTALQMDNKAGGITRDILTRARTGQKGRFQILDIMDKRYLLRALNFHLQRQR